MLTQCIDSEIIGTEKHLAVDDGGYRWVDRPPGESWYLSGRRKVTRPCLDTLCCVAGVEPPVNPPQEWIDMMKTVAPKLKTVPWAKVMSPRAHRAFVTDLLKVTTFAMQKPHRRYMEDPSLHILALLNACGGTMIDIDEAQRIAAIDNHGSIQQFIDAYNPDKALKVTYNRFGTRTGRLLVETGPDILTLKKEHRKILRPVRKKNSLFMVDFSSLEVRLALTLMGKNIEEDVYEMFARDILEGKVDRKGAKQIVISVLYGASARRLVEDTGIPMKLVVESISKIREILGFDELADRLRKEQAVLSSVANIWGRRIRVDEPIDRILVNSYIQSAAVDVALMGFYTLIKKIDARPCYIIHDAIILECDDHDVEQLKKISYIPISKLNANFPVHIERIYPCP